MKLNCVDKYNTKNGCLLQREKQYTMCLRSRNSPFRRLERNGIPRKKILKMPTKCFFIFFLNGLKQVSESFFLRVMVQNEIQFFFLFYEMV